MQAQLSEAQDELTQTQKDREYEIRQQGYQGLSDDLNQALEDTLNEVTYNAQKQEQVISEMLNHVVTNYQQAYDKINQIISNTGFTPSDDFEQNISNLDSAAGSQNQVTGSNTNAPDYTPDNFTNVNTDNIQSDSSVNNNKKIESEIEKEPNINNRPVALIELKPSSISVEEGKSATITANVRPTDAKNKTLSWTSSNTSVATVSNGSVKGVKPGSATITCAATDGSGVTATVGVTVTKKPDPPKPSSPTSGGDGVPRVGDVVTFKGSYYYDSWGQRPAGNLYSGVPRGVIIDGYSGSEYGGSSRFHGGYGIHIRSADGKYSDLGWVSLSQISGYAKGSSRISKDQLAWTQEKGSELIVSPSSGAILTPLKMGDSVIPHNLSQNLMKWGAMNPEQVMPGLANSIVPANVDNRNITIENHYDSLLTVNGSVDKESLPELKKILDLAYENTCKRLYKDAGLMGIRKSL